MGDVGAKETLGRIIRDEQDEIVKVEWKSYKKYFAFAGGCSIVIFINFIYICFTTC